MAEDPDSEVITATEVTAGNVGDAEPAAELLADVLHPAAPDEPATGRRAAGERPEVYGDAAYGTGPLLAELAEADVEVMVKVQAANARLAATGELGVLVQRDRPSLRDGYGADEVVVVQGTRVVGAGLQCLALALAAAFAVDDHVVIGHGPLAFIQLSKTRVTGGINGSGRGGLA
ncbi:transposase [Kitasatospora sp. NPDC017646]|uniref:transposase n=1 Tax=Kitasatospora sp. NPDC017646 TaxID=3364024 RepID=UPI0037BCA47B